MEIGTHFALVYHPHCASCCQLKRSRPCSIEYALLDTYRQRVEMLNHTLKPIVLPSYCGKQGMKPDDSKEETQTSMQGLKR